MAERELDIVELSDSSINDVEIGELSDSTIVDRLGKLPNVLSAGGGDDLEKQIEEEVEQGKEEAIVQL